MLLDPEYLVKELLLSETAQVADLGAGSGAFTFAAAKRAFSGKVYAIEIQRGLLSFILSKADENDLKNIEVVVGNIEKYGGTLLKDSSMDAVILANTLFQTEYKELLASEVKRILKLEGKLLLVDWSEGTSGIGPSKDSIVSREVALELFRNVGFELLRELPVGTHHYGMILMHKK